jgi:hypothetical protein
LALNIKPISLLKKAQMRQQVCGSKTLENISCTTSVNFGSKTTINIFLQN